MLRDASRLLVLGMAALGLAAGLFAGLSKSPVVGTLLTALFGLVAVGSGFLVGKGETITRRSAWRLGLLGACLAAVSLGATAGGFGGLYVRLSVLTSPSQGCEALVANAAATIECAQVRAYGMALGLPMPAVDALGVKAGEEVLRDPERASNGGSDTRRLVAAAVVEVKGKLGKSFLDLPSSAAERPGNGFESTD